MLFLAFMVIFFVVIHQRTVLKRKTENENHEKELKAIHEQKEIELIQASIQGEEEERNRIASELHDDVGATLASVRLYLYSLELQSLDNPAFIQSRVLLDESLEKIRNLSHRLQPSALRYLGLKTSLHSYFDLFTNSGGIRIEYNNDPLPKMEDSTALGVYRIVQELVNNTIKHANATLIIFKMFENGGILFVQFNHNGKGLTNHSFEEFIYKKDAIGLKNIVNRIKAINGHINFSLKNSDYSIEIQVPLSFNSP